VILLWDKWIVKQRITLSGGGAAVEKCWMNNYASLLTSTCFRTTMLAYTEKESTVVVTSVTSHDESCDYD